MSDNHGWQGRLAAGDFGPVGRRLSGLSLNRLLFLLIVIIPTVAAAVYYLLIAAPLYVSEARFVVRARPQGQPAAFGTVLASVGVDLAPGQTDAYEVHEYMMSRDAVAGLEKDHRLSNMLGRSGVDFLARYPRPFEARRFENLYRAYRRFVTVGYDSTTGISTLRVEGFRPQEAHDLAESLLGDGEALVNRLNERAEADAVTEAQKTVLEAQQRTTETQAALTRFRNRERMIDPTHSSAAGLDLMSKLETQLANLRAERATLAASAPQSPDLPVLDQRISAFQAQADVERARVAGDNDSLAPKIGEYERLVLERDFAEKSLAASTASFETARLDARRKQLYLERVVGPNTPDRAAEPRRLLAILMVFVTLLLAYGTITLVMAGLREHRQQ